MVYMGGDYMTTGQRIKAARKRIGLTQKELGDKLGISYQSIAQWENDLRKPKQETLIRISRALQVHLRDLTDSSIWSEFDKEFPNKSEEVSRYEAWENYLNSIGIIISHVGESTHTLIKDGHEASFTDAEFEELQKGAREAIEGKFYKKVLEQEKK